MDKKTEQEMVDSTVANLNEAAGTNFDSISFADPDGSNKVTYKASEEVTVEKVKVYTAQDHRRKARSLMVGRKGLTQAEKVERVKTARAHLDAALELMETEEN